MPHDHVHPQITAAFVTCPYCGAKALKACTDMLRRSGVATEMMHEHRLSAARHADSRLRLAVLLAVAAARAVLEAMPSVTAVKRAS